MSNQFNLEWAKRGGVIWCFGCPKLVLFMREFDDGRNTVQVVELDLFGRTHVVPKSGLRMATREECDDAGVEYIEPPLYYEEVVALREENSSLKARVEELKRLFHEDISNTKKG